MNYREKLEKKLGRKLLKTEIVHHKDGDSHNNRLSNLQIVNSNKEHNKLHRDINIDWDKKIFELINKDEEIYKIFLLLDLFFTARQKYLIVRKYKKNDLSKIEREYYSRSIKKKLKAICHPELHRIALNLTWSML